MEAEKRTSVNERLIVGVVLAAIGLLGLSSGIGPGYGFGPAGGFMMGPGMMGGYGFSRGYGYGFSVLPFFVTLVSLGVTIFGLYIVYDALKRPQ